MDLEYLKDVKEMIEIIKKRLHKTGSLENELRRKFFEQLSDSKSLKNVQHNICTDFEAFLKKETGIDKIKVVRYIPRENAFDIALTLSIEEQEALGLDPTDYYFCNIYYNLFSGITAEYHVRELPREHFDENHLIETQLLILFSQLKTYLKNIDYNYVKNGWQNYQKYLQLAIDFEQVKEENTQLYTLIDLYHQILDIMEDETSK